MAITKVTWAETEMSWEEGTLFEDMMRDSIIKTHRDIMEAMVAGNKDEEKFHRELLADKEAIAKKFSDNAKVEND